MTIDLNVISDELSKILLLGFGSFILSIALTPIYTHFAFKYKWHKIPRTEASTGEKAKIFSKLHKKKHQNGGLPTMSGIVFILSAAIMTLLFNWSRSQTYLPLTAFMGAGLVGLLDDVINVKGLGAGVAGIKKGLKFYLMTTVAAVGAFYFYYKLGIYSSFHLTFVGDIEIGWLMIPLFMLVVISTANAVNISDGLDGLSGGLLTSAFSAFGAIAMLQGNYGIAGFCFTIVGILMAYVWFNIHPARFMMGDIGSFSMGTALGVVAVLTDSIALLPIIGLVFVIETGSSALQILSKKIRGKKIFQVAPIHHHFEAIGWPETKVTMRFWLVGQIAAIIGIVLAIVGGHI